MPPRNPPRDIAPIQTQLVVMDTPASNPALVQMIADWRGVFEAQGVKYIEFVYRNRMPAFFLPHPEGVAGVPSLWFEVVDEINPAVIERVRGVCLATRTDGYIASGYPGYGDLVPVQAVVRPEPEPRRYAPLIVGRGTKK